jgi:hypothetical protein
LKTDKPVLYLAESCVLIAMLSQEVQSDLTGYHLEKEINQFLTWLRAVSG